MSPTQIITFGLLGAWALVIGIDWYQYRWMFRPPFTPERDHA